MRYRNVIEIQDKLVIKDTDGAEITEWQTLHTVFCSIRQLSSNEKMASQQLYSEAKYMIDMWYIASIDTTMRIKKDDGTYLDICGVDNVGMCNKNLKLICKEGGNYG